MMYTCGKRRLHAFVGALLAGITVVLFAGTASHADWREEAKEAAIKYADDKKEELIKEQSRAAITALYKKLYQSGTNREMSRALAEIALTAPELDKLAAETGTAYASGDEDEIRKANEKLAVTFGKQIARLGSTQETRKYLDSMIGKADKVHEVSEVLGAAASGSEEGKRKAEEYLGKTLIGMTPAAEVVGFYQSAYGVMKTANDKFVNGKIEDFYQAYKNADAEGRKFLLDQVAHGEGGYGYVIRDRIKDLREQKEAATFDAAAKAGERTREHLTNATDEMAIADIVSTFNSRIEKERKQRIISEERTKANLEADSMLAELNKVATERNGADWYAKTPYNLGKFASVVRDQLKADGVLDPRNPDHVKLMSELLSTAMAYGKNSDKYKGLLSKFNDLRSRLVAINRGAPCLVGSDAQRLADRLWNKGHGLAEQNKLALAVPYLQQSISICRDPEREGYLASLAKPATPAPAVKLDGTYVGEVHYSGVLQSNKGKEILRFTIAGTQVSGSSKWIEQVSKGNGAIVESNISGRVSSDGIITANFTSKIQYQGGGARPGFTGSLTGKIVDQVASGSAMFERKRMSLPPVNGTWKAVRQ